MTLKETIESYVEKGKITEELFAKLARQRGYTTVKASLMADMIEHWDCLLKKDNEKLRVEIKGLKRFNQTDSKFMTKYTWIEIHGKTKYSMGWLWGKANLIAFETPTSFILVPPEGIRELVLIKTAGQPVIGKLKTPEEMLYKKYKRTRPELDGFDRITLIEMKHLYKLKIDEWPLTSMV